MKIYKIEFNLFTNGLRDCVTDGKHYLNIPRTGFLCKETDLCYFQKYGDGINHIQCVGELIEPGKEEE